MNSKTSKILILLALLSIVALELSFLLKKPFAYGFPGSIDFIQYWSANKLITSNSNIYAPEQMLSAQNDLGFTGKTPIMMWAAPWVILILKPLLIFNFKISFLSFLVFNLFALFLSSYLLQLAYSNDSRISKSTFLLPLFFIPAWDCINYGQISILLLTALCLANYFLEKNKTLAASICFSLLSIKPHLFIYLAPMTLLWAIKQKKINIIGYTFACSVTLISIFYLIHPETSKSWFLAMLSYGTTGAVKTSEWAPATIGTWLRVIFGKEKTYLIWLPSLVAFVFLVIKNKSKEIEYKEMLPMGLSISMFCSPYSWLYDQSLFLICQSYFYNKGGLKNIVIIQVVYILLKLQPNFAQQHFALMLPIWLLFSILTYSSITGSTTSSSSSGEKSS